MISLLNTAIYITIFMLGAVIGSFLNIISIRIFKKENILNITYFCPDCGEELKAREIIPVFSFITQKGKCRHCKEPIEKQYLLMELLCGTANLWAYLSMGINFETVIAFILFPVLIALSIEDIKTTEIPYWCTGTIAVLGVISTLISLFAPSRALWYEHLLGIFIIALPFAVFYYLGAMGGGDVQLTAAAGLLLGWAIVPSVIIAMPIGVIFGVIVKLLKKRATICFAPFLSIGIAIGYIYGYDIIKWYAELIN